MMVEQYYDLCLNFNQKYQSTYHQLDLHNAISCYLRNVFSYQNTSVLFLQCFWKRIDERCHEPHTYKIDFKLDYSQNKYLVTVISRKYIIR